MDPEPDVIRRQIDETRESLTEKLETLEGQVKQTVDTVKSKVEDTVEAVTSTVEHTASAVKRTFDIPYQVRRHPYALVGGALLTGAALGFVVGRRRAEYHLHRPARRPGTAPAFRPETLVRAAGQPPGDGRAESGPGFFSRLIEPLVGEFDKIKATAVGALMGMVRDAVKRSVPPSLHERVVEIMNDITRRAGGEPVEGPLLPAGASPGTPAPGPSDTFR
jgi:ElaB/YqjD/DUF883 family membrane-anchored ribosome-binding protein